MDAMLIDLRKAALQVSNAEDEELIPAIVPRSKLEAGNLKIMEVVNRAIENATASMVDAMKEIIAAPLTPGLRESIVRDLEVRRIFYASTDNQLAQHIQLKIQDLTSSNDQSLGDLLRLQALAQKVVDRCLLAEVNACLLFIDAGGTLPLPVVWPPIPEIRANKLFTESIRRFLYSYIQANLGVELSHLANNESALRTVRERVFRTYCEHVVPAQKERNRVGFMQYVLQGSRYYRFHTFRRRLSASNPMGYYNLLMRAALTTAAMEPLFTF